LNTILRSFDKRLASEEYSFGMKSARKVIVKLTSWWRKEHQTKALRVPWCCCRQWLKWQCVAGDSGQCASWKRQRTGNHIPVFSRQGGWEGVSYTTAYEGRASAENELGAFWVLQNTSGGRIIPFLWIIILALMNLRLCGLAKIKKTKLLMGTLAN